MATVRFAVKRFVSIKLTAPGRELPIDFKDINAIDLAPFGLTRNETARQLHVIKNYELFKGVKAFVVLWNEMPRYRFLAKIFSLPGVTDVAQFFYYHIIARYLYARDIKRLKNQRSIL